MGESSDEQREAHNDKEGLLTRLRREISELCAELGELQTENEKLKAERDALLEENRQLRRQVTHSALIDDLEVSIEKPDVSGNGSVPRDSLFEALPDRFRFPEYFRLADVEGLKSNQARQRLLHYLTTDRLVQSGPYLQKTGNGNRQQDSGDGQKL